MNISDLINDDRILGKNTTKRKKQNSISSVKKSNDSKNSRHRFRSNDSKQSKHSSPIPRGRSDRKDTELIEANSSDEDSDKLKVTKTPIIDRISKKGKGGKGKGKGRKAKLEKKSNNDDLDLPKEDTEILPGNDLGILNVLVQPDMEA